MKIRNIALVTNWNKLKLRRTKITNYKLIKTKTELK